MSYLVDRQLTENLYKTDKTEEMCNKIIRGLQKIYHTILLIALYFIHIFGFSLLSYNQILYLFDHKTAFSPLHNDSK